MIRLSLPKWIGRLSRAALPRRRRGFGSRASRWVVALVAGCSAVAGWCQAPAANPPAANPPAAASGEPAGDWPRQGRDFAGWRYSPLAEIDKGNVGRLRLAWSFADGTLAGHEAAPLVVGATMYLVTPFPNHAYALDLGKPGAPIKWQYAPAPTPVAIGKACCDTVNRGPAFADGKLVFDLLDDHVIALDANSGKLLWRTKMGDVTLGETLTMAPLVVGDKVIIGNSGDRFGVQGWIAALALDSGREVWRAYSTGSDERVRIGKDFKPFYDWLKGTDLGLASWPAGMAATGGGSVDGWLSYDPELGLLFHGTGSPAPRVAEQRPGANLWTAAVFARDAQTGMARWAYPFTLHDRFGWGGDNDNLLLDLNVGGQPRKTLLQLNQNGFAYLLDRQTGELLSAKAFVPQNWASGVDPKSGKAISIAERDPRPGVKTPSICPSDLGAKGQQAASFSPRTGLVYAGLFNVCMHATQHPQGYIPGTPFDGMEVSYQPPDEGDKKSEHWGQLIAWDPVKGERRWSVAERFMTASGTLATAGDLVFYGTVDGWLRALDAASGAVLWSQKLGSGIVGQPISYQGPDGHQYVAVAAGVGGAAMAGASMPGFPARGGTLYVFSLDGIEPGSSSPAGVAR